jgi:hypothetical protein
MAGERARSLPGIAQTRLIVARNAFFDQPSEPIDNEQPPCAWKISMPNLQPYSM